MSVGTYAVVISLVKACFGFSIRTLQTDITDYRPTSCNDFVAMQPRWRCDVVVINTGKHHSPVGGRLLND